MEQPAPHAFAQIETLVKKFKNLTAARRKNYNEAETRKDFILPLFRALEWNIEDSNEVAAEEKISRGFVDFSFRLNGVRRFVLETKAIREDLDDTRWAQQAVDYAYHKGVTWAVLTDFEGLKILNAEIKEVNPYQAMFREFDVDAYLARFEQLWWLSRPAMQEGILDREAENAFKRSRRTPISDALFESLKTWRSELYKNLRLFNKDKLYTPAQIDEAVQRILDRLIFIRTAEDRNVEGDRLIALLRELRDRNHINDLPAALNRRFRELDRAYNSNLFAPHFSEELDGGAPTVIGDIIEGLYGSRANYISYNFALIDADVLGRVYEQYLGYVLSEREELEAKRAKRKQQGIYYTPTFVVKYIVQQTLGKYLQANGYNPSHPVRVLDPACGSGSFLIEAFDVLDQYLAQQRHHTGAQADMFDRARQLEILAQNLYGVDKDEQAVEVARLNLLLKALHAPERLPKLQHIRHGDSLISGERAELETYFGKEWAQKYPFDWQREFPEVFKGEDGGFDVIIGNPPYVRQEVLGEDFKKYAQDHFSTFAGTADLYVYFVEQAHRLLKPDGVFGMIVSNKFMRSNYGRLLRQFLATKSSLVQIIDFGELPVFQNVAAMPVIIITKNRPTSSQQFRFASVKTLEFTSLENEVDAKGIILNEQSIKDDSWALVKSSELSIFEKMRTLGTPLDEYVDGEIFYGVKTGYNDAFVISEVVRDRLIYEDPKSVEIIKPFVVGDDVRKYSINFRDQYLIFTRRGIKIDDYKAVKKYLNKHKERLTPKPKDYAGAVWNGRKSGAYQWYEIQDAVDYYQKFEQPKIVYPDIAKSSRFAFDMDGLFFGNTVYFIPTEDLFLLAILNSKLIFNYFKRVAAVLGDPDKGGRLRWFQQDVEKLPIRRINFDDPTDKARHDAIVALVTEMLDLQKRYAQAAHDMLDNRFVLEARIKQLDDEIDERVFELYELTPDEINIVKGT